jgi:chitinase
VTGPNQSLSSATFVASDNAMSYTNVMTSYYAAAADRWDATAQVPYLTFASATGPKGCTYVPYENVASITAKGNLVRTQGLGSAAVWTIAQSYLATAPLGQRNPLLTALYAAVAP